MSVPRDGVLVVHLDLRYLRMNP